MRSKQILQTRAMQKYENGNSCQFFKIGVVKRKRYRRSEKQNKTKQIFCYNSKKQGGFDYFKTKTDSLAIVKEIDFYPKFTRPLSRKIASDCEGLISPD